MDYTSLLTPFGGAALTGLLLAGWYYFLHYHGPVVRWQEYYSRPLYYLIGFASFLLISAPWAFLSGGGLIWGGLFLIGLIGGGGMAATYFLQLHDDHEGTVSADADAVAAGTEKGPPPHGNA